MNRIAALFLLFVAFPVWSTETLTLGVDTNHRSEQETEARYQGLAKYLSTQLPDTTVVIKAMKASEIDKAAALEQLDLMLVTPNHYLQLRDKGLLSTVLATRVLRDNTQGSGFFGGVSGSRGGRNDPAALTDLKGRRIAVSVPEHVGGYQAPAYELMQAGLHMREDVTLVEMEKPSSVIEAVLSGQVDAGFARSGIIEGLIRDGKLKPSDLHIINRQNSFDFPYIVSTRLYPEWPLVAARHISPWKSWRAPCGSPPTTLLPSSRRAMSGNNITAVSSPPASCCSCWQPRFWACCASGRKCATGNIPCG